MMSVISRNRLVSILLLMALSAATALAQDDAAARGAQAVLGQARAALGGEAKLQAVKGFSASWKFRRMEKNGSQDSGEV
jgi:predicted lysophospholipase L1 biosynthesis ABC-type transport system permease subunit